MTDTPNLGLPYIDGSQAQKHVTHNEALRIIDAAIQIGVLDLTLTAPPSSPTEGERHVVASGATGVWAGKDDAIATWQDGAWAFLAPKTGWCIWSVADESLFVYDGAAWQSTDGTASLDDVPLLGVNTTASTPNLLTVKSNAALFAAIDAADGGTGDVRLQVSKEGSANTASVFFSNAFSGRAEFGLVGADTFKLKVSADGSNWIEALDIDQDTGNVTLPRGLSLTGVVSPAQITADQDDYAPAGLAAASVLQISTDAPRGISGLAGGTEGRCLIVINVGSQPVTLLNESASSSTSNRFSFDNDLVMSAKQAAILRYDGTAARWQAIAGGAGVFGSVSFPQGRLTLQSGVPVMASSQSGKTVLYYTPHGGNRVPVYDGARMVPSTFSELSIATSDTMYNPAAIGANKVNDWFVWNDGGTLRLSHGPDWTSDTTRSAGTALTMVAGVMLNAVAITNGPATARGTYVGTTRSNASSQLEFIPGASASGGGPAVIGLWNMYNRRPAYLFVQDSTTGWAYTSAAWRAANNSAGNRISFVCGLVEDGVQASYASLAFSTSSAVQVGISIALDATNAIAANATSFTTYFGTGINNQISCVANYSGVPGLGFHYLQAIEYGGTNGLFTSASGPTRAGLSATIWY
jgi:hypothetical protein